jgi:hypothetical protein
MSEKKEKAQEMKLKVSNAVEESKRTGKKVEIPIGRAEQEGRKKLKGKKVDREKLDGSNLEAGLKDRAEKQEEGNCGHFKITKKELNKDGEYDYEFKCDETFVAFAQHSLGLEDGIPPAELKKFCMNILLAKESDQLGKGYKVRELEKSEVREPKFYKKYK